MLKRFFRDQKGQIITTELIIITAILALIVAALTLTLTPSVETGYEGAENSIKALKGGGL